MPDLHVNLVTVPLLVKESNLEYSVKTNKNKFDCCEKIANKVLNERLSSSEELSKVNESSANLPTRKKLRKRVAITKSVKMPCIVMTVMTES